MRVACVNMQKNEDHCLAPWVQYHGYLFGFENIFIIDHNSNSPKTLETLERLERSGVSVTRLTENDDYKNKGAFVAAEIHRIEATDKYDFVFPIDCDEFLFMRDGQNKPTCSRSEIFRYLETFQGYLGRLIIKENFLHILGHAGYYWALPYQKVFFSGGNCLSLDHGSHIGQARHSEESLVTRMAYAHFHFKPYEINRELSREKLRPFVDVDDLLALERFDGPGTHLKHHLLNTREVYYSTFRVDHNAAYFSELNKLFELLNIDPNFSACDTSPP